MQLLYNVQYLQGQYQEKDASFQADLADRIERKNTKFSGEIIDF